MTRELPPYVSMVDVLEEDYNANYETWKRDFYDANMTSVSPITIAGVVTHGIKRTYEKHGEKLENKLIKFCVMFLILYLSLLWLIPALMFHGDANKMNDLGTLDAIINIIKPVDGKSGVYVLEDGEWREAEENEIYGYMGENEDCG